MPVPLVTMGDELLAREIPLYKILEGQGRVQAGQAGLLGLFHGGLEHPFQAGFLEDLALGMLTEDRTDPIQADFRGLLDRKSTRLNSSHVKISYAVFCLK